MIPLSEPTIAGNEWRYVKECLDSGWVSSVGKFVNRFEDGIAKYVHAKHAVAVINGTSALHLSLLTCGLRDNDEVIVPAVTFIAPVNAVSYCGARPVFMDCDKTLCLDVEKTIHFLKTQTRKGKDGLAHNRKTGRVIKAIIPVHIFGHPVDMKELVSVCHRMKIAVIEDATESLGSTYKGKMTGTIGDVGCLSFNGNKVITTGGGGMVVTNSDKMAKLIRHLSTQAKKDAHLYDHDMIGYNYRLSNIQAAMGVAQMEQLQGFLKRKRGIAETYRKLLDDVTGVKLLWEEPYAKSNFWLNTIRVSAKHHKPLLNFLLNRGIEARPIWKLIHTLPMYKHCQTFEIVNALEAHATCLNLPSSAGLTEKQIQKIIDNIQKYFSG